MFLKCSLIVPYVEYFRTDASNMEHCRSDVPYFDVPYFGLVRAMFLLYLLKSSPLFPNYASGAASMGGTS